MKNLLKPKRLKKGDTIGVLSPSSVIPKERLEDGVQTLLNMGYKVKLANSSLASHNSFAGSDFDRASDINAFFADDTVDAIICSRGGYGAIRLLDKINYDIIKSNPKIFGGYSDITSLHLAFLAKCNLTTFHSPMVASDLLHTSCPKSIACMFETLSKTDSLIYKNPDDTEFEHIASGTAQGMLIGGNLAVMMSSFGTHYFPNAEPSIVYIEDIDERPYKIDRMLSTLIMSGNIGKTIKGFVVGDFTSCDRDDSQTRCGERLVSDTLVERLSNLGVPVISNVRCGHAKSKMTIAHGANVYIDTENAIFKTLEGVLI